MYGMFAGSAVGMALLKRGSEPAIGSVVRDQIVPLLTALVPYLGLMARAWNRQGRSG